MCFVDTGVLIGEGFDTNPKHPWAQFILQKRDVPGEVRAGALLDTAIGIRQDELDILALVPPELRGSIYADAGDGEAE